MLGLLSRTGGECRVLGHDSINETYAIREHMGYIAQRFALPADITVMENLPSLQGCRTSARPTGVAAWTKCWRLPG